MSERWTEHIHTHAVANAMMNVQTYFAEQTMKAVPCHERQDMNFDVFEKRFATTTFTECANASRRVLKYLAKNYLSEFNYLYLMTSQDTSIPFHTGDTAHTVFVCEGKNSQWYAGSPANYIPENPELSLLTRLSIAGSIEEVMEDVQVVAGGNWPEVNFLHRALSQEYKEPYFPFQGDDLLACFSIYRHSDGTDRVMPFSQF